jgi:hypothetical protein
MHRSHPYSPRSDNGKQAKLLSTSSSCLRAPNTSLAMNDCCCSPASATRPTATSGQVITRPSCTSMWNLWDLIKAVTREFCTQRFSTSPGRDSCIVGARASAKSRQMCRDSCPESPRTRHFSIHILAKFLQSFLHLRCRFMQSVCSG